MTARLPWRAAICIAVCLAVTGYTTPDTERTNLDGAGSITFVDGADTSYGAQIRVLVDT
jgi:hypothetical protein